jgi:ankyrin repeat protein
MEADPNPRDERFGKSRFTWAIWKRHRDIVKLLLGKSADPNAKGKSGATPLPWAAQKGHEGLVKLLLD